MLTGAIANFKYCARSGRPVKSTQCCISNLSRLRRGFESDTAYTALTRTVLGGNWNCPPTRATTAASTVSEDNRLPSCIPILRPYFSQFIS